MIYVFSDCILDTQRHVLHRAGQGRPLRRKVFQVLTHLLAHPDRVVSKQELCEQVWPQQFISEAALESTIKAVRQALGDSGRRQRCIQTIYGAGYRLIVPVEERSEPAPDDEDMAPPLGPPVVPALQDSAGEDRLSAPAMLTDLPDEPPTRDATPAAFPGTPDAERRQLTVMLCDLITAPPLARHLDPEDLYEVIRIYQETCAGIIRHFDGHIAQYRGEGMVAYFGYPHSHDDDAQRAVHAGLKMVEAVRRLPARLARERGIRLSVRAGIHTGEVVVGTLGSGGQHDLWALGATPTLATQIQGLAAPDTVVISGATRRLIQGYFTCRELGAQTCPGVAAPLQVYRVVQARGATHRLDAATARGLTPLVGREHEVGLLLECWGQAKTGLGRVAVISGEAGIGKSRLLRVLQERLAAEPHTRIEWRCSPYDHQSPLHPVITHLQRLVRMRPADAPAELLRRLEEVLAPYGFAMSEVVPLFAALLSLPLPERYPPLMVTPQRQKSTTLEALVAWLLAETTRQPVLFLIEDLQWMDPSTLEFLSLLIDQAPTARLLMVLTCRPEFHPPWGFRTYLTPITLGRLSHAQATILVQRVAGKALPPEVQRHLVANTDGVPLFIEELTKTVLESGLLQTHEDRYELTGPLPALAIPATLHDSLMARLDRLAPLKAVAQLGAAIGRSFAYAVLHAVSPYDETALQHGLRQLVEAELVYQRGVPPQATYQFKHALIQETAYQSLLKSTRQQYHQQIAQVLQARFPETVETQPELLAYHYTEAGLGEQAVGYWQQAGQRATQRSAYLETVQHLTTALALLATLPETPERVQQELDLQLALGGALQTTHGLAAPEVERPYARARALCAQVGDTPQLVPVLRGLSRFYSNRGALSTERELGEQLLRLTHRATVPTHRLAAHDILGHALYHLGDYSAARAHCAQGIALIDSTLPRNQMLQGHAAPEVTCRTFAACTLWCLGFPVQAAQRSQEALALALNLAHPQSLAIAHYYRAYLSQRCRQALATQSQADTLLTLATAQGLPFFVGLGAAFRGWALTMQGTYEVGLAQIRQGMRDVWNTGARLSQSLCLTLLAEAAGQAGHIEAGLHLLAEALEAYAASERGDMLTEVYRLQGALRLRQDPPDSTQAEACFQQALSIARRQQAKSWELRAATDLSRLWQQRGKRAEAYDLLAPIYGWFTEGFHTADLQEARVLLEALA